MKVIKIGAMWCPACIKTNNYLKELKNKYKDIEFAELDLDMDEDEVKKYNVGNLLPVFILLDEKENELKRIIGEKKFEEIDKEIESVLNEK